MESSMLCNHHHQRTVDSTAAAQPTVKLLFCRSSAAVACRKPCRNVRSAWILSTFSAAPGFCFRWRHRSCVLGRREHASTPANQLNRLDRSPRCSPAAAAQPAESPRRSRQTCSGRHLSSLSLRALSAAAGRRCFVRITETSTSVYQHTSSYSFSSCRCPMMMRVISSPTTCTVYGYAIDACSALTASVASIFRSIESDASPSTAI